MKTYIITLQFISHSKVSYRDYEFEAESISEAREDCENWLISSYGEDEIGFDGDILIDSIKEK